MLTPLSSVSSLFCERATVQNVEPMSFAKRFKSARLKKHLSQQDVADHFRITRNAVSCWERRVNPTFPKAEIMHQLPDLLDVSYEYLTGSRPKRQQQEVVQGLRLGGEVAGGVWLEINESQESQVVRVPVAPHPAYPSDAQLALRVKGHSVNRVAKEGAIIVVVDILAAGLDPREGDLVWVERRRGSLLEATVKELRKGKDGPELWPVSDDPAHQEKIAVAPPKGEAEVTIRGIVISVTHMVPRGK
jgi:transcriptional regulator with XRE-family HTH domain